MPPIVRPEMVVLLKEFYKDHIEMEEDYVTTRRNELRARTGLSNKDKRVPKFTMVDMERDAKEDAKKKVHRLTLEISETQVENDANYRLLANFLASFAAQMPYKREVELALIWASKEYALNPQFSNDYEHEAWSIIEGSLHRGLATYVLTRFQRNSGTRKNHPRMTTLKAVVRSVLKEAGLLREDGRKVATKGPGPGRRKSQDSITSGDSSITALEAEGHSQPGECEDTLEDEVDEAAVEAKEAEGLEEGSGNEGDVFLHSDVEEDQKEDQDEKCEDENEDDTLAQDEGEEEEEKVHDAEVEPECAEKCEKETETKEEVIDKECEKAEDETKQNENETPLKSDEQPKEETKEETLLPKQETNNAEIDPVKRKLIFCPDNQLGLEEEVEAAPIDLTSDDEAAKQRKNKREQVSNNDRKPVCALPEENAALEARIEEMREELAKLTTDVNALTTAQRKVRAVMKKRTKELNEQEEEDPDRKYRDGQSSEDEAGQKPKGRGRGKGKGKGRGRGRKGKGRGQSVSEKDGGDGQEKTQDTHDEVDEVPQDVLPEQHPKKKQKVNDPSGGTKRKSDAAERDEILRAKTLRLGECDLPPAKEAKEEKEIEATEIEKTTAEGKQAGKMKKTQKPKAKHSKKNAEGEETKKCDKEEPKAEAEAQGRKKLQEKKVWNMLALESLNRADLSFKMPPQGVAEDQGSSYTIYAPESASEWSTDPSPIGVLRSPPGFYVSKACGAIVNSINHNEGTAFKVNKKGGLSVYWSTNGGIFGSWKIAKQAARWVPHVASHPWERAGEKESADSP